MVSAAPPRSPEESAELVRLARRALAHRVGGVAAPEVPAAGPLARPGGAVVSVMVGGASRGSAARLGPAPLATAVVEAAAAAAADPRFAPLAPGELGALEVRVTVLGAPRAVKSPAALEGGADAVLVRAGLRHALVLPDRAAGWGFDPGETLRRACVAASLPASAWRGDAAVLAFAAETLEEDRAPAP
jgi:uncharacterized protein